MMATKEKGKVEPRPSLEQITQTFESSTAIIKFNGTRIDSDESLSSESNDGDDDDITHANTFSDDNNDQSLTKSSAGNFPSKSPTVNCEQKDGTSLDHKKSVEVEQCRTNEDQRYVNSKSTVTNDVRQRNLSPEKTQNETQSRCSPFRNGSIPKTVAPCQLDSSISSPESVSMETAPSITGERESPLHRSVGCDTAGYHRERSNPFNRVPFIEDYHFDTQGSFPSVSGTGFASDMDDFGTPRHESQSTSSDTDTDISLPSKDLDLALITNEDLGITEDHFSHPEGCFGLSRVGELEMAIDMCKDSVKETNEHSEQRRDLISRLVQLRMKLMEIKEGSDEDPDVKLVLGHKFHKRKGKSSNHQCEMCNSVIWGLLQSWHRCLECGFRCHSKCLNFVKRQCAGTKILHPIFLMPENLVSKRGYIMEICPESALSAQSYRCAECRTPLSFKGDAMEPRQCDYDGHYYCSLCHWNDTEIIPARVIHNWDFETRRVCRQSKQFLKLMQGKAVLCVQQLNPMLFNYVEELSQIKKLREEILVMKMYFMSCRKAMEDKLLLLLQSRPHFVESPDAYTLQDLMDTKDSSLLSTLSGIHSNYAVHIRIECPLCQARGFICELCNADEILYPFDMIAAVCSTCSSVYHRDCFYKREGECPKCHRLSRRTVSGDR